MPKIDPTIMPSTSSAKRDASDDPIPRKDDPNHKVHHQDRSDGAGIARQLAGSWLMRQISPIATSGMNRFATGTKYQPTARPGEIPNPFESNRALTAMNPQRNEQHGHQEPNHDQGGQGRNNVPHADELTGQVLDVGQKHNDERKHQGRQAFDRGGENKPEGCMTAATVDGPKLKSL
jgi:hypothetical protein